MNISLASSSSRCRLNPLSNNDFIKVLEKQKDTLLDQIQTIRGSKLDDQTKNDKIKALQELIKEINSQIQEKRTEKLKQQNEASQKASDSTGNNEEGTIPGSTSLIQAANSYSLAKTVHNTKDSLHKQGVILDTEIKLDEARGGNDTAKRQALQDIQSKEKVLAKDEEAAIKSTQEQVNKASRESKNTENSGREGDKKTESRNTANYGNSLSDLSNLGRDLLKTNPETAEKQGTAGNPEFIDIRV